MAKILVLHGPNLNLLGKRETGFYGIESLAMINDRLQKTAAEHGHELSAFQSNSESALIDKVHAAGFNQESNANTANFSTTNFIIINPAAFTHTSIALREALTAVNIPFIEVHISNIYAREPFRHHSYFSEVALGVIAGMGAYGYDLALQSILHKIKYNLNNN